MFNIFKKKKKQSDDEEGFKFAEFSEEIFKEDEKSKQLAKQYPKPANMPQQGWVCGTPEAVMRHSMEQANNSIPEEVMKEVEAKLEEIFKDDPRGIGFCHKYWSKKRTLLHERGYRWYSPQDFSPHEFFD